jgi:serine/threonine-protein kinase
MDNDEKIVLFKTDLRHAVVLPDGKQPLPLGSGSIAGLLGVGGMSNVYKIWNPQMEQYRAVKLMKPDLSTESRQRFQTEIKIMAALSHPNIIEIHSVGEWNALSYIEMEYIEGATLADDLAKKGALPLQVSTALGILIARALAYAHDKEYVLYGTSYRGLIHRDLKPSNIMIAGDGRVKLMDFGIARPVETSLMTLDGAVMGTMQYLSPEQTDGKNVGVAADLYALGEILYETITGRKAFPQINLSQLMSVKTANIFTPLKFYRIRMPKRLTNLVHQCMRNEPDKRPGSAAELLEELESIHEMHSSETPEQVIKHFLESADGVKTVYLSRRRAPGLVWVAAGIITFVAGTGAWFALVQSHTRNSPPRFLTTLKTTDQSPAQTPENTLTRRPNAIPNKTTASAPPSRTLSRKSLVAIKDRGAYVQKVTAPPDKPSIKGDPLEAFTREIEAGNYSAALDLFDKLPSEEAVEKSAQILRLRALCALGKTAEAWQSIGNLALDDGELFLIKARLLMEKGDAAQALQCLEKSVQVGARMVDPATIRRDYLYYRAVCMTRAYEASPTDERRKDALDGWFEVKNSLRKYPNHAYFRKAVSEMQRIGSGASLSKGP